MLTALLDSILIYIEPSPEKRDNETLCKTTPPAPATRTVGTCPTLIQMVGALALRVSPCHRLTAATPTLVMVKHLVVRQKFFSYKKQ